MKEDETAMKISIEPERGSERVDFYSRFFGDIDGGTRIVIIPKDGFEPITETPTTYILTFKK